jgi:hypothetical protein
MEYVASGGEEVYQRMHAENIDRRNSGRTEILKMYYKFDFHGC